jgi:hypothetical protein
MVLGCGRTNDQHKPRKSKVDVCPPGGGSPVITTIGHGDSALRSLPNPCSVVQRTGHLHGRGIKMASGQREQGRKRVGDVNMANLLRSADGSSTPLLGPLPRRRMQPRKYACAWASRVGARLGALFRTVLDQGY